MDNKRRIARFAVILSAVLFVGTLTLQKTGMLRAAVSRVDTTLDQLRVLMEVFDYIQQNYVAEKTSKELAYGAAAGMVRTLDPFSQFLEPEAHKDVQTETEGEFGGLGIRIQMMDNVLTVLTPIPDTPAYRAGILPGDKIVKIEGESTEKVTLQDAVKKMRGKPGTKVTISVLHEGGRDPVDYTIVREVIKIESVRHVMLEDRIGYVQILEFTAKTSQDMDKALDVMSKDGMDSLVLDLRNNPGGLLNSAVAVSKKFISDGKLIVYTQGRRSDRIEYRADAKAPYADIPLVVMVNEGSASGSEIVVGALQDHHRALIAGTTTFGKASVQSVIPLSDGSGLRLTTAHYYTPNGRNLMRDFKTGVGGLVPDVMVPVSREVEVKLRNQQELVYAKDKSPHSSVKQEEQVEDAVLKRAVEFLKARRIFIGKKAEPAAPAPQTAPK